MKWHKIKIAKAIGIATIIFCIMIAGLYAYIAQHKERMLTTIQTQFARSFKGSLSVRDIRPNFWKQFPNISFELQDVVIRDDLWEQHHKDFLNVSSIYVKVKLLPLFWGKLSISKLIFSKGSLHIFEDAQHFSNASIFEREDSTSKGQKLSLQHFELEDFDLTYEHFHNNKRFKTHVIALSGSIDNRLKEKRIHLKGLSLIEDCSFNRDKGSFLKNKTARFKLSLVYVPSTKTLHFNKQSIEIDKNRLSATGVFQMSEQDNHFALLIASEHLDYNQAISWLSPNIWIKLKDYSFLKPIQVAVSLSGKLRHQPTPKISIHSNIRNNDIKTKVGRFSNCSFSLAYDNGQDSLLGDPYATLLIHQLHAAHAGIAFFADTTRIQNLKSPQICTHISSSFAVPQLNRFLHTKSFEFTKGKAMLDLKYCGKLNKVDSLPTYISGFINIDDADFSYLPRQINFNHCKLELVFDGQNLSLRNSSLNTQKSHLSTSAFSKNFVHLILNHPEEIVIEANLASDKIDLNEFQGFIQKRKAGRSIKKHKNINGGLIDNAFAASSTLLNIKVAQINYQKFEAKDISAQISLLPNSVRIDDVQLKHSDGHIHFTGRVAETKTDQTNFSCKATVKDASIDKLLYSFDNFSQTTFMPNNIKGKINLDCSLSGAFNTASKIISETLKGTTTFELMQGQLIDFKPLERMGSIIFKKKRLSNIHFEKLKNTLSIEGNRLKIPPMWINTDLIDMQLEGVYNLDIGTDLLIEIPLFKFSKEDITEDPELANNKGFRLYVRGKDDEHGDLKFSVKMRNKEISAAREERKRNKAKRQKQHEK